MADALHVDVTVAFPRPLRLSLRTDVARIGVAGPSGTGKTTLVRVLAGLERRARGVVRAGDETWQRDAELVPPHRRRAALVPQDARLFPHLSVWENLTFARGADGARARALADELEIAHLLARRPRHLSGGERQRTALGRALLAAPRLLLLDEPFSALDPARRDRVRDALARALASTSTALVLVSHDPADGEGLVDARLVLGDDGALGPAPT